MVVSPVNGFFGAAWKVVQPGRYCVDGNRSNSLSVVGWTNKEARDQIWPWRRRGHVESGQVAEGQSRHKRCYRAASFLGCNVARSGNGQLFRRGVRTKKVPIIIGLGGCEGRRKAMLEAGFGHAAGTGVPIDDLGRGSSPGAIAEEPVGRNVHFSCP